MTTRKALVAPFVVTGHSRHELLCLTCRAPRYLNDEHGGCLTSENRGLATMVADFNLAALSDTIRKARGLANLGSTGDHLTFCRSATA